MKGNNTIYVKEQIKIILSPIFQTHNIQSAVLFGSYAKGTPQENSDIDILVDSGLHGLAFYGLLEDVANHMLLKKITRLFPLNFEIMKKHTKRMKYRVY